VNLEGDQDFRKSLKQKISPALAVVFTLGFFLVVTSTFYPLWFLSVFDAKRILQLGAFVVLILFAVSWSPLRNSTIAQLGRIRRFDAVTLGLFFAIGLVSALQLLHPAYALVDVSMIFVMVLLVFITAASRNIAGIRFDRWGILLLAVMGAAVSLQEFMGIVVGWVTGAEFSYQQALVHFAHPRFYNHLQTWSIPVIAALPLLFPGGRGIRLVCIFLLGLQWFLVTLTGARGTTVGLVTAMVFVAFWLPGQRRFWLRYQVAGLLTALLIYAAVWSLNTLLIPQSGGFYANSVGRPLVHTSGRSTMWRLSLQDAFNNPVTGAGPTRYACDDEKILFAHPHSFPFQVMGEWGFIAFFLLLMLASRVGVAFLKRLRSMSETGQTDPPLRAMLATSLIAGVIHSCLSSVLLMPASQTAMILVAGWMLSLTRSSNIVPGKSFVRPLLLTVAVLFAGGQFVFAIQELPRLTERTVYAETGGPMAPRFWQDGKVCKYAYSNTKD